MDFEKSLKAFKFVDISKDLYEYAATFGANLKEKNLSEIEIYLSQSFEFCAAFFGALGVGVKPILLAKPIYSGDKFVINDENFGDFFDFSKSMELKFDQNSTFFLQTSGSTGNSKNIPKKPWSDDR